MKQTTSYKKSLMILAFSFLALTGAFAQDAINKGAWLVGASSNMGYTSTSVTGGGSSSSFDMQVGGGYFFMDNLVGGLTFSLSSPSGGTSSTGIGPFARYYFAGKFYVGAGFVSQSSGGASTTLIPLEAGVALFITDNIAVEPGLRYTTYDGGSQFGIRVGFNLYLNRNK